MVTAVMAAPVPPPTIAAMPIMAQVGTPTPSTGWMAVDQAPNAPPTVAPMNSEGEKMPPDAPEPRLSRGRKQLARRTAPASSARQRQGAGEDRLDVA